MSKYTTEVRYICEVNAGLVSSEGYSSINKIITDSMPKIFDFDYPIFDEAYRSVLQRKILKHYYTREIATETVGLWKHFLDMRLNEIMPYYNKLYQSELLEFNPLYDVDITTDHVKNGTSNGNENTDINTTSNETKTGNITRTEEGTITDVGTNSNTRTDNTTKTATDSGSETVNGAVVNKNTRRDYYSDTPQGAVTNVENETYLTNYRKIVDDGTGSTNNSTTTFGKVVTTRDTGTVSSQGTDNNTRTLDTETNTQENTSNNGRTDSAINKDTAINTTEDYLQHVKGKTSGVSFSKLLNEYRETFINIDMMIIDELSDLFFGLW